MRVAELWSHPVKSLVGTSVDTAVFDRFGMVGDRVVAFRDLRRGRRAAAAGALADAPADAADAALPWTMAGSRPEPQCHER